MKDNSNLNDDGSLREANLLDLGISGLWGCKKASLAIKWRDDFSRNHQIMTLKKYIQH